MKKERCIIKTISFTVLALLILGACSNDKKNWLEAKQLNSIQAYEDFIANNPESEFFDSATYFIEELSFRESLNENTDSAYNNFIKQFPNSEFCDSVYVLLEKLEFENTLESNSILSYISFIKEFPESRFLEALQLKNENETLPFENDFMKIFHAVYSKSSKRSNYLTSHLTADGTVEESDGRKTTYRGLSAVKEFSETDIEKIVAEFVDFDPFIPIYIKKDVVLLSGGNGSKFKRLSSNKIQVTEGILYLIKLNEY